MDQEQLRKEKFYRISSAYKSGDIHAYSNTVLEYIDISDRHCFIDFYNRYLNVNASIDDVDNCGYEFCFEREKRVYPVKQFCFNISYDVFKYIEPTVMSVCKNFCDTGNSTMPIAQWIELSAKLKDLSAELKAAQNLEDMRDYVFSLNWAYNQVLFMDVNLFLQRFPSYLDGICAWIDKAVLDGDNIWIMGP